MSACSRGTLLTCHLRLERCCSRKPSRTPHGLSQFCPAHLRGCHRPAAPVPSSAASPAAVACSCRGTLDVLGDHRAAFTTSGVLAFCVLPLERAIARVCQETGARVGRMNLDRRPAGGRRRFGQPGLPRGRPQPGADTHSATPPAANAGTPTPNSTGAVAAASSSSASRSVAVGPPKPRPSCCSPAPVLQARQPHCAQRPKLRGCSAGAASLPLLRSGLPPSSRCP